LSAGWQIRDEARKLATVATTEHGLDTLLAFFKTEAALSNGMRQPSSDCLALEVRGKLWLHNLSTPDRCWGRSRRPAPAQESASLVSAPACRSQEDHQQAKDQEGKHQVQ